MAAISRRAFLQGTLTSMGAVVAAPVVEPSPSNPFPPPVPPIRRAPRSLPDPNLPAGTPNDALPFDHVVIVMQENHSFDNYFGMLPVRGQPLVDGFTFDSDGNPLNDNPVPGGRQRVFRMPGTCQPNGVTQTWDATHHQIGGGAMDGFAVTDSEAMGYWDEPDIPFYYSMAKTFCVGNRYFCSVPAQTYPNRRFLYAASAQGMTATSDSTFTLPPPPNGSVMDNLARHGVSFMSYFTDLPDSAIIPTNLERYPEHFTSIATFYADCLAGTLPAVSWVDTEMGITSDIGAPLAGFLSKLPAPLRDPLMNLNQLIESQGGDEENPDDVAIGEAVVARIVQAVMRSPAWERTLLIWNYDEHGGYYDHVPPPTAIIPDAVRPSLTPNDVQGAYNLYGIRVPNAVISPYSKPHGVTNVVHDHTSVIATIANKWNLPALSWRDANANDMTDYLDLTSPPAFLRPPPLAAPARAAVAKGDCALTPAPVQLEPSI
ncbi:MAG TPA: alkaline phosphatase family protein [Acidimicrobiales bacterium]|nr:alkaline phosphatase family protein [Acidimicrobiales bacterium]